jgi:hypothetical protein
MGFVFVKMNPGEIVSTSGGLVFRKLEAVVPPDPPQPPDPHTHVFVNGKCECGEVDPNYNPTPDPPQTPETISLDLTRLGLPPGKYLIRVTANAKGYMESDKSNAVIYTAI